jgi:superfamily II DNA or RNA helicase
MAPWLVSTGGRPYAAPFARLDSAIAIAAPDRSLSPRAEVSVSLIQRCAHAIPPEVRRAGQSLVRDGRAATVDVHPGGATVAVEVGPQRAVRVAVDWSSRTQGQLGVDCTCRTTPADDPVCDHGWAAILHLAEEDRVPAFPRRQVEIHPAIIWPDDTRNPEGGELPTGSETPRETQSPLAAPTTLRRTERGAWRRLLDDIAGRGPEPLPTDGALAPGSDDEEDRRIDHVSYALDVTALRRGDVVLSLWQRRRRRDGEWGPPRPLALRADDVGLVQRSDDRTILGLLAGVLPETMGPEGARGSSRIRLRAGTAVTLLPPVARTGRLYLATTSSRLDTDAGPVLRWSDEPWRFELEVRDAPADRSWRIGARFLRADRFLDITSADAIADAQVLLDGEELAPIEPRTAQAWVKRLREQGALLVPRAATDELRERLWQLPDLPARELPVELRLEEEAGVPTRRIAFVRTPTPRTLMARVSFEYAGRSLDWNDPARGVVDAKAGHFVVRDADLEAAAIEILLELGLKRRVDMSGGFALTRNHLPAVVEALVAGGWRVEAEGSRVRSAGTPRLRVRSGIDWFDLDGEVSFGDEIIALGDLLLAASQGERFVRLGDGSRGLLPETWLATLAPLGELGSREGGGLRFRTNQAVWLEAVLGEQVEMDVDETYARVRASLRQTRSIEPQDPSPSFQGILRDYQKLGLSWLRHLRDLGLGGCLADDMGLGKTVQVLALRAALLDRDEESPSPWLVVVPRSLVTSWVDECARFVPKLQVIDYTGLEREARLEALSSSHMVITTYGTLRKDAERLHAIAFDTVVLDEAQAIKNASSLTAKSARALDARHRLVLTGTPVENHLGDLLSLFEFLNPGLLGGASVARAESSPEGAALMGRALAPLILRRTKEKVLTDLPAKVEQTIHCRMEDDQRAFYDAMRARVRATISKRIEEDGFGRSKIHVLEALLRLRQAACHPGLVSKRHESMTSTKIETLLALLDEIVDEGHKALVFSQFTSFLRYVKEGLDEKGIRYTYLDGRTRKRSEKVKEFQEDPDCKVFVISLKAGGQGLNLTAADYVFVLDPWWNPAVESQAIDRAHRIGQTRPVMAYRLLCQDTVEERIQELQGRKKRLAEALVTEDDRLVRNLTMADLELLLG